MSATRIDELYYLGKEGKIQDGMALSFVIQPLNQWIRLSLHHVPNGLGHASAVADNEELEAQYLSKVGASVWIIRAQLHREWISHPTTGELVEKTMQSDDPYELIQQLIRYYKAYEGIKAHLFRACWQHHGWGAMAILPHRGKQGPTLYKLWRKYTAKYYHKFHIQNISYPARYYILSGAPVRIVIEPDYEVDEEACKSMVKEKFGIETCVVETYEPDDYAYEYHSRSRDYYPYVASGDVYW